MGCIMQVVLTLLLVVSMYNIALTNAQAGNEDYYCGTDYLEVGQNCALPCPSGDDSECFNALGDDYVCFFFTGCADKIANGFVPPSLGGADVPVVAIAPTSKPIEVVVETPVPTSKPIEVAVETPVPTSKPIEVAVETPAPVAIVVETTAPVTAAPISPSPITQGILETAKPTRRTRRPRPATTAPVETTAVVETTPSPTLKPTLFVDTPSPTKRPVVTASPTIATVESIKTASNDELLGNLNLSGSSSTATSYGFIFTLRTTPSAPVMEIIGLDFLTATEGNLNFELYTKPGSYEGSKVTSQAVMSLF
eukprot:scaffold120016_cov74-Cyclotella_meneghiniana.AAC.3